MSITKNHSNVSILETQIHSNSPLDTKQTAKELSLAEITVRNSRTSGLLCGVPAPKFRKIGRKVVYFKKDIDDWLAALPAYQNTSEVLEGK
jgi:predicted DNA-binding transcriptional regulator AlpA